MITSRDSSDDDSRGVQMAKRVATWTRMQQRHATNCAYHPKIVRFFKNKKCNFILLTTALPTVAQKTVPMFTHFGMIDLL